MSNSQSLSLIIPLWNEEENIGRLGTELNNVFLGKSSVQIILVNNGSEDSTIYELNKLKKNYESLNILIVDLKSNYGYGGAIRRVLSIVETTWAGWIPGDLQIRPVEVIKLWSYISTNDLEQTVVKGIRLTREDGILNGIVSLIYTTMARFVLGVKTRDVNALPKIIPIDLISKLPKDMRDDFLFDTELLYISKKLDYKLCEIPVVWFKRHKGKSSWMHKRFRTYLRCFIEIFKIKKERRHYVSKN